MKMRFHQVVQHQGGAQYQKSIRHHPEGKEIEIGTKKKQQRNRERIFFRQEKADCPVKNYYRHNHGNRVQASAQQVERRRIGNKPKGKIGAAAEQTEDQPEHKIPGKQNGNQVGIECRVNKEERFQGMARAKTQGMLGNEILGGIVNRRQPVSNPPKPDDDSQKNQKIQVSTVGVFIKCKQKSHVSVPFQLLFG